MMRHLYHEAAKTQKYGNLTDEEALALVTVNPAKQLGIESRVGSLEVGKDADIAIFKNHPLSIYGVPQVTIVDGIVRFDREKDADDMRLMVDPKQNIEEGGSEPDWKIIDNCMDGTEFLFEELFEGDKK
jgi:cytosine/adenosine deaminase-related metal-dependent hydrolase